MPNHLIFVRHGESEANEANHADKNGSTLTPEQQAVKVRPDWQQRLTGHGVEQAVIARKWLLEEFGPLDLAFDKKYFSPFVRTRETAMHLGGVATTGWRADHRLVERSWGTYGAATLREQEARYHDTKMRSSLDPLYTGKDGGEALASDVLMRVRDFLDTLHREAADQNVIAVTHGEFMWVVRYMLERMLPEEWLETEGDKSQQLQNCSVLHYTRINPSDNSDIRNKINWMRIIYPDAPNTSPSEGQWRELENARTFTGAELATQVEKFNRILSE